MHIVLTNDDGVHAAGIRALYRAFSVAHRVTVVAPASEQSGIGHAFTFHSPLFLERVCVAGMGNETYAVSGTPSDCVKMALSVVLDSRPDAVVSGMNIGENSGLSGYYSGTVAGAREGAFWNIPSYAFSVCEGGEGFYDEWSQIALSLFDRLGECRDRQGSVLTARTFFNVNFPSCAPREGKGVRFTRQSMAWFNDRYRTIAAPDGRTGHVIYGEKQDLETSDAYDSRALLSGYTTITPLQFDATASEAVAELAGRESPITAATGL